MVEWGSRIYDIGRVGYMGYMILVGWGSWRMVEWGSRIFQNAGADIMVE